ncbi:hypothetical protein SE17_01075 [Kouleothrix aurantiaca]|uniref:Uncharacterized protein n=1 Tax=Kouleothrix aurantiaca TaxID=186479 RepID=A0A0P9D793_9CHLR|nr:hypothetical protein SE17_01075 [Kouleothrix aurantiaca]
MLARTIQALAVADERGAPAAVFSLLPEATIWAAAQALLHDPDQNFIVGPTLVQAIGDALLRLSDQQAAQAVLLDALTPTVDSLIYERATIAVLRYASHWDTPTAKRFSTAFSEGYKATIAGGDMFIAGLALEGMLRLPLYRHDPVRLLAAIALTIDEFPPLPDDPGDAALLPVKALKLLGQCYDAQPNEIVAAHLRQLVTHTNTAVDAEARYNLGLVRLYDAFRADDDQAFYAALLEAEDLFRMAAIAEENRSDAELFGAIARCFAVMTTTPLPGAISDLVQTATAIVQERLYAFGGATSEQRAALEYTMGALVTALDRWVAQVATAHQAPNIALPMRELAQVYAAVRDLSAMPGLPGLASHVGQTRIMLPHLRGRFAEIQEITAKLTAILSDPLLREHLSPAERELYELTLAELRAVPDPKPAAAARLHSLRAAADLLAPAFARQIDDLLAQNLPYDEVLLGLVRWYFDRHLDRERVLAQIGGPAHDIYTALVADLRTRLQWDERNLAWQCLANLLKLITRYVVSLYQITREEALPVDVNFLFAKGEKGGLGPDANERHLEAHLYSHLWFAQLFLFPEWVGTVERQNISDVPGRTDLTVRFPGSVVFVLEIKCEPTDSSRVAIQTQYLAQAQSYAGGTQQVSLLMVLDTTPKPVGVPLPDVRDCCYVDRRTVPGAVYPDCVVVCIVPANRFLPSTHTKGASGDAAAVEQPQHRKRRSRKRHDTP